MAYCQPLTDGRACRHRKLAVYRIISLVLILCSTQVYAQQSYLMGTAQGFRTAHFTFLHPDAQGNMWIGSYDGLYKHEGARLLAFTPHNTGKYNLPGAEMQSFFHDKQGMVWVGTTAGLYSIDPITYQVRKHRIEHPETGETNLGYINSIFQDPTDSLWISCGIGMVKMHPLSGAYRLIPVSRDAYGIPHALVKVKAWHLRGDNLWMHTEVGMARYNLSSRQFEHRYHNPRGIRALMPEPDPRLQSSSEIAVAGDGTMYWMHNHYQLIRYHPATNTLDSTRLPVYPGAWTCCKSLLMTSQQQLWIAIRGGGILIVDPAKNQLVDSIVHRPLNSPIPTNFVASLAEDIHGRIWVSTSKGISVITYPQPPAKLEYLEPFREIAEGTGYLSGSLAGDSMGQLFIPFRRLGYMVHQSGSGKQELRKLNKAYSEIGQLVVPAGRNLLLANGGVLTPVNAGKVSLPHGHDWQGIHRAAQQYPGMLQWIHFADERSVFLKKTTGIALHYRRDGPVDTFSCYGYMPAITVSADSLHLYYLNGRADLVRMHMRTAKRDTFQLVQKIREAEFPYFNPRSVCDDGTYVWIASQNGLLRYHTRTHELRAYGVRQGLAHGFVYALSRDDKGRLWAASMEGIDYYNPQTDRFEEALRWEPESYNDAFGTAWKSPDGTLYFTAGSKLATIQPDGFGPTPLEKFDLILNEVNVNGEPVDFRQPIQLNHRENRMQVRFALLSFENQKNLDYQYRLLPGDTGWISDPSRGNLFFNELTPRAYRLQMRVVDPSEGLMASPRELAFTIRPAFWQTTWFSMLLLLAAAGIAYAIYRQRIRQIQRRAAIKNQLAELEAKALRAQMNPHFIFNSLNAIQELVVTGQTDNAYHYLSQFSRLLRQVLHHSDRNLIPLSEELQVLRMYIELESLRFRQSFHWSINVPDSLDTEELLIAPMLLQPYVENAIWHGLMNHQGDKRLRIDVEEPNGNLVIRITDNGIGRAAAQRIKAEKIGAARFESKGTRINGRRLDTLSRQYGSGFSVETEDLLHADGSTAGTRVTLIIPQTADYSPKPGDL